jgi:hypothetical protein
MTTWQQANLNMIFTFGPFGSVEADVAGGDVTYASSLRGYSRNYQIILETIAIPGLAESSLAL